MNANLFAYTHFLLYNVYIDWGVFMSRTNIVLDDKLVNSALKITKLKTRRALVDYALREILRHAKQHDLLKLRGKIHWEGDLETSREGRNK